jgi:hypothetical protein
VKRNSHLLIVLVLAILGCNIFSTDKNDTISNSNSGSTLPASNTNRGAVPTPTHPGKQDYVGRWGVSRDFKDHVIELREDGTGTITLDENGKSETKQDFTWAYQANNVQFTVKKPIVDPKSVPSGSYTIHAKLTDDGKKLQTDFSAYTRSKGDDVWEKK